MSEKIKGIYGSETRANEVLEWLKSQGANVFGYKGNTKDWIYYVDKGHVKTVNKEHSVLFDIVELPRWRAKVGEPYCYVADDGIATIVKDRGRECDNCRYEVGNYFKTLEEARQFATKIREIFKRKEAK